MFRQRHTSKAGWSRGAWAYRGLVTLGIMRLVAGARGAAFA